MVFGDRELSDSPGNRGVTNPRIRLPVGSMGSVNTQNDFGASKAPAGLELLMSQLK